MKEETRRKVTNFTCGRGEALAPQYDEFDEIYACVGKNHDLVRCCDCVWEGCPMRGERKE